MLKFVAKVDWQQVGDSVFVTLTYPDAFSDVTGAQRKRHRDLFFLKVERFLGKPVSIVWKTEWMPRKSGKNVGLLMPHYHLMVLDVKYIPHKVVREFWAQTLGHVGHLATDVRKITGPQGAGRYLAKYIAKAASLDDSTKGNSQRIGGRMWGVRRPSLVPMSDKLYDEHIDEDFFNWCQAAYKRMNSDYDENLGNGFTLLGKERVEQFLSEMEKDVAWRHEPG